MLFAPPWSSEGGSALGPPLDRGFPHVRPAPRVRLARRCRGAGLGWGLRVRISHKLQGAVSSKSTLSDKKPLQKPEG